MGPSRRYPISSGASAATRFGTSQPPTESFRLYLVAAPGLRLPRHDQPTDRTGGLSGRAGVDATHVLETASTQPPLAGSTALVQASGRRPPRCYAALPEG